MVEAAHRSGALNSAGYARDLGRPVLAVPGPVTSAMSAGCHRLIQRDEEPARLVTSVAEVLAYCGSAELEIGGAGANPVGAVAGGATATSGPAAWQHAYDSLDVVARSVLDGFPGRRRSVTEAELSRLSGQPISQVIAALPVLQGLGLITAAREGYRLASVAS